MSAQWRDGNQVRLLENGESFYPRVFQAIRQARKSVRIETFILFEDKVGLELRDCLIAAARAGAVVDLTIDGYGSPSLSKTYLDSLLVENIRVRVFDPRRRLLGIRTNLFRRLHRKIVVVDGEIAFVGGINFSADHLADFGPEAKQDYAAEVRGPVVTDIGRATCALVERRRSRWRQMFDRMRRKPATPATQDGGDSKVALVTRDNSRHRGDIERQYRIGIRAARNRVVIANAYFLPGYRLLRALRNAAQRGVKVRLILQGQPDMPLVTAATRSLYGYLLPFGVEIFEYCERPFHGKVALVDDEWATVGSSNLDPLSLWFNLEANLLIRDRQFNRELDQSLSRLAQRHCTRIERRDGHARWSLRPLLGVLLFHFLRHFPRTIGSRPHFPRIQKLSPRAPVSGGEVEPAPATDASATDAVADAPTADRNRASRPRSDGDVPRRVERRHA